MPHPRDIFFEANDSHWHGEIAYAKTKLADNKTKRLIAKVFSLYPTEYLYEQMAINLYTTNKFITIKNNKLLFRGKPFSIDNVVSQYGKVIRLIISINRRGILSLPYDPILAKELGGWFSTDKKYPPTFIPTKDFNKLKD